MSGADGTALCSAPVLHWGGVTLADCAAGSGGVVVFTCLGLFLPLMSRCWPLVALMRLSLLLLPEADCLLRDDGLGWLL